jgi:hypothetical protein
MNDIPGRRRNIPADPTSEPASDPVPTGEDVIGRDDKRPARTPRRYDSADDDNDAALPSNDATLNTQI